MVELKTNFICKKVCNILECFLILRDDCLHKYMYWCNQQKIESIYKL